MPISLMQSASLSVPSKSLLYFLIQHFRGGKLHFVIQTADGLTFGEHNFCTALFLDLFSHFFDAPCCKFGASVHRRKKKITCALLGQTSVPHFPKIELKRAKFGKSGISVCLLENLEFLLASWIYRCDGVKCY